MIAKLLLFGLIGLALAQGVSRGQELSFEVGKKFEIVRLVQRDSQFEIINPAGGDSYIYYLECTVLPPVEPGTILFNAKLTRVAHKQQVGDGEEIRDTDIPDSDDYGTIPYRSWIGETFRCRFTSVGNFEIEKWPRRIRDRIEFDADETFEKRKSEATNRGENASKIDKASVVSELEREYRDYIFPNFAITNTDESIAVKAPYGFSDMAGFDFDVAVKEKEVASQPFNSSNRRLFELTATCRENRQQYRGVSRGGATEFKGSARIDFHQTNRVQIFGQEHFKFMEKRQSQFSGIEWSSKLRDESWTMKPISD